MIGEILCCMCFIICCVCCFGVIVWFLLVIDRICLIWEGLRDFIIVLVFVGVFVFLFVWGNSFGLDFFVCISFVFVGCFVYFWVWFVDDFVIVCSWLFLFFGFWDWCDFVGLFCWYGFGMFWGVFDYYVSWLY